MGKRAQRIIATLVTIGAAVWAMLKWILDLIGYVGNADTLSSILLQGLQTAPPILPWGVAAIALCLLVWAFVPKEVQLRIGGLLASSADPRKAPEVSKQREPEWLSLTKAAIWIHNNASKRVREDYRIIAGLNGSITNSFKGAIVIAGRRGTCRLRGRREPGLCREEIKPDDLESLNAGEDDTLSNFMRFPLESADPTAFVDVQVKTSDLQAVLSEDEHAPHTVAEEIAARKRSPEPIQELALEFDFRLDDNKILERDGPWIVGRVPVKNISRDHNIPNVTGTLINYAQAEGGQCVTLDIPLSSYSSGQTSEDLPPRRSITYDLFRIPEDDRRFIHFGPRRPGGKEVRLPAGRYKLKVTASSTATRSLDGFFLLDLKENGEIEYDLQEQRKR